MVSVPVSTPSVPLATGVGQAPLDTELQQTEDELKALLAALAGTAGGKAATLPDEME